MSENDYIAEYIKENRPEIIYSFPFIIWKMGRMIEEVANDIIAGLKSLTAEEEQSESRKDYHKERKEDTDQAGADPHKEA